MSYIGSVYSNELWSIYHQNITRLNNNNYVIFQPLNGGGGGGGGVFRV